MKKLYIRLLRQWVLCHGMNFVHYRCSKSLFFFNICVLKVLNKDIVFFHCLIYMFATYYSCIQVSVCMHGVVGVTLMSSIQVFFFFFQTLKAFDMSLPFSHALRFLLTTSLIWICLSMVVAVLWILRAASRNSTALNNSSIVYCPAGIYHFFLGQKCKHN